MGQGRSTQSQPARFQPYCLVPFASHPNHCVLVNILQRPLDRSGLVHPCNGRSGLVHPCNGRSGLVHPCNGRRTGRHHARSTTTHHARPPTSRNHRNATNMQFGEMRSINHRNATNMRSIFGGKVSHLDAEKYGWICCYSTQCGSGDHPLSPASEEGPAISPFLSPDIELGLGHTLKI